MKKEKKSELIHDALGHMDDDLIEATDRLRKSRETNEKAHRIHHWRRWTTLAASICVLVIGSQVWSGLKGEYNTNGGNAEALGSNTESEDMSSLKESVGDSLEENAGGLFESETSQIEDLENEWAQGVIDRPTGGASGDYVVFSTAEELSNRFMLKDNYSSVSVLVHKSWSSAMSEAEIMAQAVIIGQEYTTNIDALVDAMYSGECGFTENLSGSDDEMTYHLFFERNDGEIIHCWLLEDGKVLYNEASYQYISLDRGTYETIYKICEMYW